MAADSEEVLVRVKSASHPSCEDVEFSCDPKATSVRQVKEKIRTLYSFHPDIADQRLIYAGHLLDDVQLLTDVFGLSGAAGSVFPSPTSFQHSGPYTIHLACTSKSYINPNQRNGRNENHSSDTSQRPFQSQIPNPMMQDPRLIGNMQGNSNPFDTSGSNGIPPEFYALHQLYVEQMNAYMQNWNSAYGISGSTLPGFFVNQPNMPTFNVPGNNNVPPPQPPLRQPQQPAPQNVPQPQAQPQQNARRPEDNLGAGIGGFFGAPAAQGNDDEENQRDLLDWMYTLSRLALILSVVWFYSNFTRFLLVVIFFFAIALLQRRPPHRLQNRRNPQREVNNDFNPVNANPVPNDQNPEGNAQAQDRDVQDGAEAAAELGNNNENNNNTGEAENAAQPASGVDAATQAAENNVVAGGAGQQGFAYYRDVTWTFLTTFFTSLIPEMHQHN